MQDQHDCTNRSQAAGCVHARFKDKDAGQIVILNLARA